MDIQLPMFEDLRYWTSEDLAQYAVQCQGDLNRLTVMYKAELIPAAEMKKYFHAIESLKVELQAVHNELAYRALQ
jgi:hypothetical protein